MTTRLKTTDVGYENRNRQLVMRRTAELGNDHNQRIYVLRCLNPECRLEYGANGSDVFQRKCPRCQGGRPGLPIRRSMTPTEVLEGIASSYEPEPAGQDSGVVSDHDRILYRASHTGE